MQTRHDHAAPTAPPSRTGDEAAALATFARYGEAFRALDSRAVSAFFQEPALFLSPHGDFALTHAADVERVYARVMSEAKERGYARTAFDTLRARRLGADQVAVEGSGRWIGSSGEDHAFDRVPNLPLYVLQPERLFALQSRCPSNVRPKLARRREVEIDDAFVAG
jgi:hypothetical protein